MKELGLLLKVSPAKLYHLLAEGDIPGARKIGDEWRIYAPTIHQWLDGRWPQRESAGEWVPSADRT